MKKKILQINKYRMPMKVIKGWRKSLSLKVDNNGEIIVRAPHIASEKMIKDFVDKHKEWIERRKATINDRKKLFTPLEKYYFLGKEYTLVINDHLTKIELRDDKIIFPKKYEHTIKERLEAFYKKEARLYIEDRLREIGEENNLRYKDLRITSARTRWGSCSSKKNLSFSYRLILAPPPVVDYVIVHELSHLLEMNHSKRFWAEVNALSEKIGLSDYRIYKKWLKDNGGKISYM